ncbi:MAG: hypothetical protein IPM35_30800 [Myxococcales bacterium]|nr:hypothetical protein [Myxococcales bacterium]
MARRIAFDPMLGYPAGPRIRYECVACGSAVWSMPDHDDPWRCACGNLTVDGDAGRVSVKDHGLLEIVEVDARPAPRGH